MKALRPVPILLVALLLAIPCVGLAARCPLDAPVPNPTPTQIKAALTFKLARFVTWPDESLDSTPGPVVFAVLGSQPLHKELAQVLKGRDVQGRSVETVSLDELEDLPRCHVLFVDESFSARLPEIIAQLGRDPVLLIGETTRFAQRGGMINFYSRNGSYRFEINPERAKKSGLVISSKILKLARIVKD